MAARVTECTLSDILSAFVPARYSRIARCAVFVPCHDSVQQYNRSSTFTNDLVTACLFVCPSRITVSCDRNERPGSHSSSLAITRRYIFLMLPFGEVRLWPVLLNCVHQNSTDSSFKTRSYRNTLLRIPEENAYVIHLLTSFVSRLLK